jgi:hypothetical protein
MNDQPLDPHHNPSRVSWLSLWLSIAGVCVLAAFAVFSLIWHAQQNPQWLISNFEQHFAATVGLPLAMVAALVVVTLFRHQSGPIEFEFVGFKLRGSAGPIIMWVLVFLAMALAIKMLW